MNTDEYDRPRHEAQRILACIAGLEPCLGARDRAFVEQMRRVDRVSEKQLRWLQDVREKCFD